MHALCNYWEWEMILQKIYKSSLLFTRDFHAALSHAFEGQIVLKMKTDNAGTQVVIPNADGDVLLDFPAE